MIVVLKWYLEKLFQILFSVLLYFFWLLMDIYKVVQSLFSLKHTDMEASITFVSTMGYF